MAFDSRSGEESSGVTLYVDASNVEKHLSHKRTHAGAPRPLARKTEPNPISMSRVSQRTHSPKPSI